MSSTHPTSFNKRLGAAVRARRVLAGISQEALAKELGVTFQQQQKREYGKNRISTEDLVLTAQFLSTTPQTLINEALAEHVPALPETSRTQLTAIRNYSRLSENHQRAVSKLVSALANEEAA